MNCIHSTSIPLYFRRYDKNSQNDQLPVGLIAQLVEMMYRYHRGYGFESFSTLKFKRLSYFKLRCSFTSQFFQSQFDLYMTFIVTEAYCSAHINALFLVPFSLSAQFREWKRFKPRSPEWNLLKMHSFAITKQLLNCRYLKHG